MYAIPLLYILIYPQRHIKGIITRRLRQLLMGESLGKAVHIDGSPVSAHCVPMVSIGTTDLHAVGQLFLAGVAPVITTFVTCTRMREMDRLTNQSLFEQLVPDMGNKSLHELMQAVEYGVMQTYAERSLPYIQVALYEKSMSCIGQLMQLYVHQVIYLAQLLQVNAFDQPEVESYKRQVRKRLADA